MLHSCQPYAVTVEMNSDISSTGKIEGDIGISITPQSGYNLRIIFVRGN